MKISSYILTCNSEQYLEKILTQLSKFSDEIVVLDSGSSDTTLSIAKQFPLVKTFHRDLDNFKNQRNHAASLCQHDTVFYVDSDEIPDDILVHTILAMKDSMTELGDRGYAASRQWFVMGRPVHSIYPVVNPDWPVRLFDRRHVSFNNDSNIVHETLGGQSEIVHIKGTLKHYTFRTREEINQKLEQYTSLAAEDLIRRKGKVSALKSIFSPIASFIKWYVLKKGFLDGRVGLVTGGYAYRYSKLKYRKAFTLQHQQP